MGWLIVIALVVAAVPVVVAATSMQRRVYLRWVSGWVGRDQRVDAGSVLTAEVRLTTALPGRVIGVDESNFSGDGYLALVDSGLRFTEWPEAETTLWGAFWHDVTGYVVHRQTGTVWIEVSGHGSVHVDTGHGPVQEDWESILQVKGVPLSDG